MPEDSKPALLTALQRQILSLISKGLRDLDIANALSLDEAVVRTEIRTISDKLHLSDRLQLAIYANRHNL